MRKSTNCLLLNRRKRNGNVAVFSSIMMVALVATLAFAIDLAYLMLARDELQRTADASALAAAWEFIDEDALTGFPNPSAVESNARSLASSFAAYNQVLKDSPALATQDVVIGYLDDFTNPNATIDLSGTNPPNAIRVLVRRTSSQNGQVPFFLADVLGLDGASAEAETTAAVLANFGGFQAPTSGGNLDLLPFALDLGTWTDMLNGVASDVWSWDPISQQVQAGSDGVLEVNLFPQSTGSPGNRGTVDIGSSNNSTADIARQIVHGVSPADLAYHGGSLEFDQNGEMLLNGDTGISAGVKDELESIKGQPRCIPIFSQVTGNGNNAQYTIVQFAGIRIVEVKLTGSNKRVMIQPANVVVEGGIPATDPGSSNFVYSPAWIVK